MAGEWKENTANAAEIREVWRSVPQRFHNDEVEPLKAVESVFLRATDPPRLSKDRVSTVLQHRSKLPGDACKRTLNRVRWINGAPTMHRGHSLNTRFNSIGSFPVQSVSVAIKRPGIPIIPSYSRRRC